VSNKLIVVSWNINSLRARLPLVLRYLAERKPDILCLQETRLAAEKVTDVSELRELGYHVRAGGTRGYAGVAVLSRLPFEQVVHGFGADNQHSDRRLLCQTGGWWVDNVYVPTRRAIGKSEFLDGLHQDYSARFAADSSRLLLCGDFNVCFDERDLASLRMISESERFGQRPEDLAFRRTLSYGLHDCFRKHHGDTKKFSWFPQTPWALKRNYGMRLDYIFATQPALDCCIGADHDFEPRSWERPSDHLPVVALFSVP
jgi:exodeoxyribonuclease III